MRQLLFKLPQLLVMAAMVSSLDKRAKYQTFFPDLLIEVEVSKVTDDAIHQ